MDEVTDKTKKRRFFPRKLRTYLIYAAVAGIFLGWYLNRVEKQKAAVRWLKENGGYPVYDFERNPDDFPLKAAVGDLIGKDYNGNVTDIQFHANSNATGDEPLDIGPIKTFRWLEELDLSGTAVVDISPLQTIQSLQELDLSGTAVVDIGPIAALRELKSLKLPTTVTDLSPLADLVNLKTLDISAWNIQTYDISPLLKLVNLEQLNFGHANINDLSPLISLENLKRLSWHGTNVQDLDSLSQVKSLENVHVQRVLSTSDYGRKLCQVLPPTCELSGLVTPEEQELFRRRKNESRKRFLELLRENMPPDPPADKPKKKGS